MDYNKTIAKARGRKEKIARKRLEITKQVQQQNKDLIDSQAEREKLMAELQVALSESEKLRDAAVEDLETLQKRTQFELVGLIVKVALGIIGTVAFLTSLLYFYVISKGLDAKITESTWSNLFGILLTNSFSIIGTIMGVKYASGEKR